MLRIALVFLTVIALCGLGLVFASDFGYVQISLAGWNIETTVAIAVIVLIVGLMFGWVLIHLLSWPFRLNRRLALGRDKAHAKRLAQALVFYLNEEHEEGIKRLTKIKRSPLQLPALLLGAHLAQKTGDYTKRGHLLRQALQLYPSDRAQIQLVNSICLQQNGEIEPALQGIQSLLEQGENTPSNWRRLTKLLTDGQRWVALRELLAADRIELSSKELLELKVLDTALAFKESVSAQQLDAQWSALERRQKTHPVVVNTFIDEALKHHWKGDKEEVIRKALDKQWDERVLKNLLMFRLSDVHHWLKWLESQTKAHDSKSLRLTMAALAAQESLWGIASEHHQMAKALSDDDSETQAFGLLLLVLQGHLNEATVQWKQSLKQDYPLLTDFR